MSTKRRPIKADPAEAEGNGKAPAKPKQVKQRGRGTGPLQITYTLADAFAGYLATLERDGRTESTIFAYGMELKTAASILGEHTLLADLTPEKIRAYFEHQKVLQTRTGQPKARPTVDKTRRVLRLALLWAAENRMVDRVPLPEIEEEARRIEPGSAAQDPEPESSAVDDPAPEDPGPGEKKAEQPENEV
jgi:hypothetical protein